MGIGDGCGPEMVMGIGGTVVELDEGTVMGIGTEEGTGCEEGSVNFGRISAWFFCIAIRHSVSSFIASGSDTKVKKKCHVIKKKWFICRTAELQYRSQVR